MSMDDWIEARIRSPGAEPFYRFLHALLLAEGESTEYWHWDMELYSHGSSDAKDDPLQAARGGLCPNYSLPRLRSGGTVQASGESIALTSASSDWIRAQVAAWERAGGTADQVRFERRRAFSPDAARPTLLRAVSWILGIPRPRSLAGALGEAPRFRLEPYPSSAGSRVLEPAGAIACDDCGSTHGPGLCADIIAGGTRRMRLHEGDTLAAEIDIQAGALRVNLADLDAASAAIARWDDLHARWSFGDPAGDARWTLDMFAVVNGSGGLRVAVYQPGSWYLIAKAIEWLCALAPAGSVLRVATPHGPRAVAIDGDAAAVREALFSSASRPSGIEALRVEPAPGVRYEVDVRDLRVRACAPPESDAARDALRAWQKLEVECWEVRERGGAPGR
jgi:hypothetical protein